MYIQILWSGMFWNYLTAHKLLENAHKTMEGEGWAA